MKTKKEWLQEYINKGYSFFNISSKTKKIFTPWTKYQTRKPTTAEIETWLKYPTQNYAIVCGEVSDLIVFDVDTKNDGDPTPFLNRGLYEVRTPSGGYHFYCKYDPLLKSIAGKTRTGFLKGIDIQSDGKLAFCPPSKFENGEYILVNYAEIKPIPEDILALVLENLEPEREIKEIKPYKPQPYHYTGDAKTGDIFNALTSWEDLLIPLGWEKVGHVNKLGVQYWRRPNKKDGISASTNWGGHDLLIPFTTSTALQTGKGYTKFGALTALQYNGDFRACSIDLVTLNAKLAVKNKLRQ